MLMFDKIRSKVGKKAHDAKILIKIKSKDFAMSRKITYFAPLPRNRCQEELLGMLRWVRSNNLISKKTMDLIKIAEEAFATGKQHPSFKAGDTITVAYRIVEGNKERVQMYRGVVIKICGHGEKKRFTVRKMSGTVGVERIFPFESPAIDSITVNKIGKVRSAKLYYLRKLTGKKARIQEKRAN